MHLNGENASEYSKLGGDNFGGAGQLTAAQTAAVLGRLQGENATDSWNKALANNSNKEAISRQATMKMLYDTLKAMGKAETVNATALTSFKDAASVNAANLEAMQWAVSAGILNGVGDNTLDPSGSLTRAQYATILQSFVEYLAK